jgi:hypothetical protein
MGNMGQISGGKFTINAWIINSSDIYNPAIKYTGSDNIDLLIYLFNDTSDIKASQIASPTVKFSNGNASVTYSSISWADNP